MMGIAKRRRRRHAAGGTLLAVVLLAACALIPARLTANRYVYEDLPAGGGFPVDFETRYAATEVFEDRDRDRAPSRPPS